MGAMKGPAGQRLSLLPHLLSQAPIRLCFLKICILPSSSVSSTLTGASRTTQNSISSCTSLAPQHLKCPTKGLVFSLISSRYYGLTCWPVRDKLRHVIVPQVISSYFWWLEWLTSDHTEWCSSLCLLQSELLGRLRQKDLLSLRV